MEPNDIAALAQRVHDAEGWKLGASSTREYRNTFWARVVGMVYHGHAGYGVVPDPRWHLKDGGGGRPQSDDVAVRMPDRHFWDFIGGVGADGYTFGASGDHGPLPMSQNVYPPPVPEPVGGSSSGGGGTPLPAPPPTPPAPDLSALTKRLDGLIAVASANASLMSEIAATLIRIEHNASVAAHESQQAAGRASDIKTQIANLPASRSFPRYKGRVPKPFGGSTEVILAPEE